MDPLKKKSADEEADPRCPPLYPIEVDAEGFLKSFDVTELEAIKQVSYF